MSNQNRGPVEFSMGSFYNQETADNIKTSAAKSNGNIGIFKMVSTYRTLSNRSKRISKRMESMKSRKPSPVVYL